TYTPASALAWAGDAAPCAAPTCRAPNPSTPERYHELAAFPVHVVRACPPPPTALVQGLPAGRPAGVGATRGSADALTDHLGQRVHWREQLPAHLRAKHPPGRASRRCGHRGVGESHRQLQPA